MDLINLILPLLLKCLRNWRGKGIREIGNNMGWWRKELIKRKKALARPPLESLASFECLAAKKETKFQMFFGPGLLVNRTPGCFWVSHFSGDAEETLLLPDQTFSNYRVDWCFWSTSNSLIDGFQAEKYSRVRVVYLAMSFLCEREIILCNFRTQKKKRIESNSLELMQSEAN